MPPAALEPLCSVIIPVVDEASSLCTVIAAVRAAAEPCEIIVVDGGSSDDSARIALSAGARVVRSRRRQRGSQLNLGAQHARAAVLLFLHADTLLPQDALREIMSALKEQNTMGGAFARRYASRSLLLRFTCSLAWYRNQLIGWHLGDQAMFVRRATFFQLGGFREVDRFEDLDFSRRLRRFGRTVTLRPYVTSSSRRFHRFGAAGTTLCDFMLTVRYLMRGLPSSQPGNSSLATPAYECGERIGSL